MVLLVDTSSSDSDVVVLLSITVLVVGIVCSLISLLYSGHLCVFQNNRIESIFPHK